MTGRNYWCRHLIYHLHNGLKVQPKKPSASYDGMTLVSPWWGGSRHLSCVIMYSSQTSNVVVTTASHKAIQTTKYADHNVFSGECQKLEFLILRIFSVWYRYLSGSSCWHHHQLCKCLSRKSGFHKEASSWPDSFSALQMEMGIVLCNLKSRFLRTSRSAQQVKNVSLTLAKVRLLQYFLASFA